MVVLENTQTPSNKHFGRSLSCWCPVIQYVGAKFGHQGVPPGRGNHKESGQQKRERLPGSEHYYAPIFRAIPTHQDWIWMRSLSGTEALQRP